MGTNAAAPALEEEEALESSPASQSMRLTVLALWMLLEEALLRLDTRLSGLKGSHHDLLGPLDLRAAKRTTAAAFGILQIIR